MAKPRKQETEYNIVFAVCDLTSADKPDFEAWQDEMYDDMETVINSVLAEGYRLSIKFDFNNSCYQSSLTMQDQKSTNYGKLLTARAGYPMECLMLVLYKHIRKLNGGDWPVEVQRDLWG